MPTRRLQSDRTTTPSFVQPFLRTLNQMREQEPLRPDRVTERASDLLQETFGPAREPIEATFAHASIGVMADHTHYFDGFALLMSVPFGVAVAVREASGKAGRVIVATSDGAPRTDPRPTERPTELEDPLARVAAQTAHQMEDADRLDLAVVSTVPPSMRAGSESAAALATARAISATTSMSFPRNALLLEGTAAVEKVTGAPFSIAYLLASGITGEHTFVLVDTATLERLELDVPTIERPGWAIVNTPPNHPSGAHSLVEKQRMAKKALEALRSNGFEDLGSFRDLQHRDLERATGAVPRRLRPVVQHLVTENAKVQRLVAAVRRRDWQMFGALLVMSHASKRSEWGIVSPESDFIVERAEQMSLEGIYGATHLGERNGAVLVVGQPFSVPPFLERTVVAYSERFETDLQVTLI